MVATTALASDRLLQLVNGSSTSPAVTPATPCCARWTSARRVACRGVAHRAPAARTKDVEVGTSVGTGTPAVVHGDRDKLRTVLSTSPGTR